MKRTEKLTAALGETMRDSVGVHVGPDQRAGESSPTTTLTDRFAGLQRIKGAVQIPLDRLTPDPNQPREEFDPDALQRLAGSLKSRGQVQAIRVRWDESTGKWIIVSGERRWRAAQLAGLPTLNCVEAPATLSPDEILEDQIVENCLREDLRPVEQARAFETLMNRKGLNQKQLADYLHLTAASVTRSLAMLRLPEGIQEKIDEGELTPTVAYELTKVADPVERDRLANEAIAGRATRQVVEGTSRRPRPVKPHAMTPYGKVVLEVAETEADPNEAFRKAIEYLAKSKKRGAA